MPQLHYAPTKTNLLKLREDLKFARQGHELLDQKRNILIVELLTLVDQTVNAQARMDEKLAQAYAAFEETVLRMGKLKVRRISSAVNIATDMTIRSRKVMGVQLPVVDTKFVEKAPYFSPLGTSFRIDGALAGFREALREMGKLAELRVSVLRLANEVRKTIRKVNALEKIAIPDLKDTVKYIEGRLEENERDMFVLMKMVKQRLEKRKKNETEKHGEQPH